MSDFPGNLAELRLAYSRGKIDGVTYRTLRRAMVAAIASGALPPSPLIPMAAGAPLADAYDDEVFAADATVSPALPQPTLPATARTRTPAATRATRTTSETKPVPEPPPVSAGAGGKGKMIGAGLAALCVLGIASVFLLRPDVPTPEVVASAGTREQSLHKMQPVAAFLAADNWSPEAIDAANIALGAVPVVERDSERGRALMNRLRHTIGQRLDQERELVGNAAADPTRVASLTALARNAGIGDADLTGLSASDTTTVDVAAGAEVPPKIIAEVAPVTTPTSPATIEPAPPSEPAIEGSTPVVSAVNSPHLTEPKPPTVAMEGGTTIIVADAAPTTIDVKQVPTTTASEVTAAPVEAVSRKDNSPSAPARSSQEDVTAPAPPTETARSSVKNERDTPPHSDSTVVAQSRAEVAATNGVASPSSTAQSATVAQSPTTTTTAAPTPPRASGRGAQRPCEAVNVAAIWSQERPPTSPRAVACQDVLGDGSSGPALVVIPPGTFRMGGNKPLELPQHSVTVSRPLAVGRYEITVREFLQYAHATHRQYPGLEGQNADLPVVNVSWREASDYAAWLSAQSGANYRLPSEAEWEYFARAGATTRYSKGDVNPDPSIVGSFDQSPPNSPKSVKTGTPNNFFLLHALGNVREWVQDAWRASYNGAPEDGGAINGSGTRITRGGGFRDGADGLRLGGRTPQDEDARNDQTGFRVVREIKQ